MVVGDFNRDGFQDLAIANEGSNNVTVLLGFTRPPKISVAAPLRNTHNYRRGALPLGQFVLTGSVEAWSKYLDVAYPGRKPAHWD